MPDDMGRDTIVLPWSEADDVLGRVVACLDAGGTVAIPTDTVYGLAVSALHPDAVRALYQAKGRPKKKPIPILIGDAADLNEVACGVRPVMERLAAGFWPGPLTMVLPTSPAIPDIVTAGQHSVGLRMPDHPVALAILRACGFPVAVSSANLSGGIEPTTAAGVLEQLAGRIDLVVDGGESPGGVPSTVIDFAHDPFRILRKGPVSAEQMREYLSRTE